MLTESLRLYRIKSNMCGIICEICYAELNMKQDKDLMQRISRRGPDRIHETSIEIGDISAFFCGSVLWMQGNQPTVQPLEDYNGVLLYNGDIFDNSWERHTNDTITIMKRLSVGINKPDHIIRELKSFKGPFSLIYYDKHTKELYFTRDRIGRNTLLLHKNDNSIIISSVLGRKYECIEIPATHLYKLNIITKKIELYSWSDDTSEVYDIQYWLDIVKLQQDQPDEDFIAELDGISLTEGFEENIVKFIDEVAHESLNKWQIMERLLAQAQIEGTVKKLVTLLELSVKIRVQTQPNKCKKCLFTHNDSCEHSTVGILFSGGLDCTVLAFIANKYVPVEQSIDLYNVAFKKEENSTYNVPDRITGRQSFEELKKLCPSRKWMFKEVDVPKELLEEQQKTIIADLVHPRKTILDESLGSALWFAAKGRDCEESNCRVLLLGSGADELFGGYTRHRNAFRRHGWSALSKELQLDWKRISFRNLARDNRVICDHGCQPRMPYLDEDFVDFALKLKPWLKCYPCHALGPGIGDKLILRLVAFNLGLREVTTIPKRALQFGSRIANKKERGCDLSKNLCQ